MEEMTIIPRPEKLMINRYLRLRTVTAKIARALGFLALSWSAVVLLAGFIHDLPPMEFRLLAALTFVLLPLRMMEISVTESKAWTAWAMGAEYGIIRRLRQQEWIKEPHNTIIVLRTMQLVKLIFAICVACHYLFSPFVGLGVSVWRLVWRDYIANGGAKLNAALDVFYALFLLQSLFDFYYSTIFFYGEHDMPRLTNKHSGLEEDWGLEAVRMYYSETRRKLLKDGKLPCNWDLITYAVGLLQSASGVDHRWGARVLDKLFDTDASVRRELLSSRISIQNLIAMIGIADNIESRERAARIVAHLTTSVNITHFPGAAQCICSLLEQSNCKQCYCEPQVTASEDPQKILVPDDKKDQHETSQQHRDDAYMAVPIKDQTDGHEYQQVVTSLSTSLLVKRKGIVASVWEFINNCRQRCQQEMEAIRKELEERPGTPYEIRGAKELIFQGLLILERLTRDEGNCGEISRHQRLVSKITSPLSSHDFLSNAARDKKMVGILSNSLTVVSRLLTSHGDGATRLRHELASKPEAVSNLMAVLEPADSEGAQEELSEQALEILTNLAFDDSFKKLDFVRLLKALVRIFLEKEASNNTAGDMAKRAIVDVAGSTVVAELEQADREHKAIRMRRKAGEALARLLPLGAATDVVAKQEAIDLLTKVFDQILSSKMGKTADAVKSVVIQKKKQVIEVLDQILSSKIGNFTEGAIRAARETKNLVTKEHDQILSSKMGTNADAVKRALTQIENLPTEALGKILSRKMEATVFVASHLRILIRGIEKQSEEIKSMAAILSLATVMCNKNAMSREDFACATPGDETLVKKLKEILKVNEHCTPECLEVVKLTCHLVVAMIQAQPSCVQRFNEHNFEETLAEALEAMSEVDDCMLFAGNDHEVIRPARSLASLVKEAQELLKTA